jgi:uncharacterized protein YfiM (DUF2279 family)
MNLCILVLCLSLSAGTEPPRDRWVAEDKWRHFFTSFTVTALTAGVARLAGADAERSAWVGASVGAGAGIWKELRDVKRPDATASVADLVWDAAGVGAGAVVALQSR